MLFVIVADVRVVAGVPAGPAAHPTYQCLVVWRREPLKEDRGPRLAVVEPVEAGVELLVVHPVPAKLHLGRFRLGVLPEMSFQPVLVQRDDAVVGAQGVQDGPVQQVFERVVRAVVAGPARHAQQVPALVEVAGEELLARPALRLQQLPLQQRPARRRLGCAGLNDHVSVGPSRSVHERPSHHGNIRIVGSRWSPLPWICWPYGTRAALANRETLPGPSRPQGTLSTWMD